METFDDVEELGKRLANDFGLAPFVIGVDGNDGVGKTQIALTLASYLSAGVISLDTHLARNDEGRYVDFLRVDDSQHAISQNGPLTAGSKKCPLSSATG